MTTIVSPDSSPSVVYNAEGRTIGSYVAAGDYFGTAPSYNDAAHATVITRHAQTTIALVSSTAASI